ncbi:MAG: DNA mismatch repair endonuclease MutL [Paludibacteraceae bacterium]|nr:DNA mismatch repair endonuclease MutL [Paludibacteraceae bacterium]
MNDIIHVLPDTVANQIAAGEVIQRPSSVVKELVENSIDAGAKHIQVIIKDAGRTLIQVIDDGKGMSETDARLAFERHATSKLQTAEDLFSLTTMGFRGEALASIASVAQVELRTRRAEDEVGTCINIAGCQLESQEPTTCPVGCNFSVKNLFFNVPARRKFLKSNKAEFSHIEQDFLRIALVYPELHFELRHIVLSEETVCYNLPPAGFRERIVAVFGKQINTSLLSVKADSSMAKIYGFVGKPEDANRSRTKQFFFVNGRFMKHPYFHKAVVQAYDRMLQDGTSPDYFLYFEMDPENIDVNIHPTKTEIKFENETEIWKILMASVKEALGRFNVVPSIDFDNESMLEIPPFKKEISAEAPQIKIDPSYNPFKTSSSGSGYKRPKDDWQQLYAGFENDKSSFPSVEMKTDGQTYSSRLSDMPDTEDDFNEVSSSEEPVQSSLFSSDSQLTTFCFQLRNKYILTTVRSGLMCIDQHRAHVRILFEQYLTNLTNQKGVSQKLLFPDLIELTPAENSLLEEVKDDLYYLGFDISDMGNNTVAVNGLPAMDGNMNVKEVIYKMLESMHDPNLDVKGEMRERLALSLANLAAIPSGKVLHKEEMEAIISQLFSISNNEFTPDNKRIFALIQDSDLDKMFK